MKFSKLPKSNVVLGLCVLVGTTTVARAETNAWQTPGEDPAPATAPAAPTAAPKPKAAKAHTASRVTTHAPAIVTEGHAETLNPNTVETAPSHPQAANGKEGASELTLRVGAECFNVTFDQTPGQIISCTQPLALEYTRRDCSTQKLSEIAEVDAAVSCEDERRVGLRFRTGQGVVVASLRVQRRAEGRSGLNAIYRVESARLEETSLAKLLPEPRQKPLDGSLPEEAPLQFKFSGFAAIEHERTRRFGYSGITNFTDQGDTSSQGNTNFLSNLNFEVRKDRTSLVSLVEIGEVYFGDSSSGGGQGSGSTNLLEMRNLYLNHEFNDFYSARAGKMTTYSDPRSFIFNDHVASAQFNYKTDRANGYVWYANSTQNRPTSSGTPQAKNHDYYWGASGSFAVVDGLKANLFYVNRGKLDTFVDSTATTVTGDSITHWIGGTADWAPEGSPLAAQLTGILNKASFKSGTEEDKLSSHLLDGKLTYNWAAPQVTFGVEGLMTPGSNNGYSGGNPVIGKRKNFQSPVATSYLMTIATSDGLDDAPGSAKSDTIAPLSQAEGLQLVVVSASVNVTKRLTALGRYGYLRTAEASATTGSRNLGQEFDLQGVYQLTPATSFQLDYGRFAPGAFYTDRKAAELVSGRLKFTF